MDETLRSVCNINRCTMHHNLYLMKFEIENPTAEQFLLASALVAEAKQQGWDLEDSEIGFNPYSGYVYVWSESEVYSMGICEYQNEGIQFIWTNDEDGTEIIADSLQGLPSHVSQA